MGACVSAVPLLLNSVRAMSVLTHRVLCCITVFLGTKIYNVLEICDKMCCFVGTDVLDAAFLAVSPRSRSGGGGGIGGGIGGGEGGSSPVGSWIRKVLRFGQPPRREAGRWPGLDILLAVVYVFLHSVVLLYQVVTLQVAMNSNNNALFTLMISNNFVELKGSVFKKFEKDNLFQIAYADMTERFQLGACAHSSSTRQELLSPPKRLLSPPPLLPLSAVARAVPGIDRDAAARRCAPLWLNRPGASAGILVRAGVRRLQTHLEGHRCQRRLWRPGSAALPGSATV